MNDIGDTPTRMNPREGGVGIVLRVGRTAVGTPRRPVTAGVAVACGFRLWRGVASTDSPAGRWAGDLPGTSTVQACTGQERQERPANKNKQGNPEGTGGSSSLGEMDKCDHSADAQVTPWKQRDSEPKPASCGLTEDPPVARTP